jgi:hypothetical protein
VGEDTGMRGTITDIMTKDQQNTPEVSVIEAATMLGDTPTIDQTLPEIVPTAELISIILANRNGMLITSKKVFLMLQERTNRKR